MSGHVVIVGAGQAGLQAADSLRAGGFSGRISLTGDEPCEPYQRPPLSKAWLAGLVEGPALSLRTTDALARKNIELIAGRGATAIDTQRQVVEFDDGQRIEYTGLLLATGATPRRLACDPEVAPSILTLRSRPDADRLRDRLARCREHGRRVVVIGGGFIGLEVAATARKLGHEVTVLEAASRLMERSLAPGLSEWYAALHRAHGVDVELGVRIEAIRASADGLRVILTDGRSIDAGLVLAGIGVIPNDALARAAGIECDNGIVVDACGRTSAPNVVAAGDCAARRLIDGKLLRLESVQNAIEQGKAAASALLGIERPVEGPPWFWSDQYDRKLQIVGLSRDADQSVVRGDMNGRGFSVFHYQGEKLIAVDSVNAPKEHFAARQLLTHGVSPSRQDIADPAYDLAQLLPRR